MTDRQFDSHLEDFLFRLKVILEEVKRKGMELESLETFIRELETRLKRP